MKIFFLTKDFTWDYVNVKYLPAIPDSIKAFFGEEIKLNLGEGLHRLNRSEYPSIFVKNDGEHWGFVVTGFDSGRLDRTNCTIAINVIVFGDHGEECDFSGLIERVVLECFANNGRSEDLMRLFTEVIHKGDPAYLSVQYYGESKLSLPVRESNAGINLDDVCKNLIEKLQRLPHRQSFNDYSYSLPFYGGMSDEISCHCFIALCNNLLSGKEKGIALAFNLVDRDLVMDLWQDFNFRNDMGILLNSSYDLAATTQVMQMLKTIPKTLKKKRKEIDKNIETTTVAFKYNSFIDFIINLLERMKF